MVILDIFVIPVYVSFFLQKRRNQNIPMHTQNEAQSKK